MAVAVPEYGGGAGKRARSLTTSVFGSMAWAAKPRGHGVPATHDGSAIAIPAATRRVPTMRTLSGVKPVSCAKPIGFEGSAREKATICLSPIDTTKKLAAISRGLDAVVDAKLRAVQPMEHALAGRPLRFVQIVREFTDSDGPTTAAS